MAGVTRGSLMSPPLSTNASPSGTRTDDVLPRARSSPLRVGTAKESTFIRYVDQRILHIKRRITLSSSAREVSDGRRDPDGYTSSKDMFSDMDRLLDVIWISGTPSLQVPYFLSLALILTSIPDIPLHADSFFNLLRKLDLAFASLVQERSVDGTQRVRIQSLIEHTRVTAVEAFNKAEFDYKSARRDESDTEGEEDEHDMEDDRGDDDTDGEVGTLDMSLARVYDRTMTALGALNPRSLVDEPVDSAQT